MLLRETYMAKPIIALYHDEADAILDNVVCEENESRFYEWLDEWHRFIFKDANFIIKSRNSKGNSVYAAYRVSGRNMLVVIFSDDSDDLVEFTVNPDYIDFQDMAGSISKSVCHGDITKHVGIATSHEYLLKFKDEWDGMLERHKNDKAIMQSAVERAENEYKRMPIPELEALRKMEPTPENKAKIGAQVALAEKEITAIKDLRKALEDNSKEMEDKYGSLMLHGQQRISLMILATLFHFHDRQPHVYEKESMTDSAGYNKHNDLYNPVKRLDPPTIVRPKNGTRSWFEQQRAKHTESWHVKGHHRTFKADRYKNMKGKSVWVNPFIKGTGENMRLSVYVATMAGKDVVEVEGTTEMV